LNKDSGKKELVTSDILGKALANLNEEQIKTISAKAAEEALNIQKREVDRDSLEIRSRKEAEDHVETFNELHKDGKVAHEVITKSTTATGSRTITSRSGTATAKSACFVATSAFDDFDHPTVDKLRLWRDASLKKYKAGQWFITWYYKNGESIAFWLDKRPNLKPYIRNILSTFVAIVRPKG
jgi:hypothetical protein